MAGQPLLNDEQCDDRMAELAELWSRAQPVVGAMVAGGVINFHDAEDVVAQIASAVVRNFSKYDASRPFLPWVLGIARNQLLQYYERQAGDRHSYFDGQTLQLIEKTFEEVAGEMPERLSALLECVEGVRGRARRVLGLRYQRGQSAQQIGEQLGMSRNAVWTVLHRVRLSLRDCIDRKLGCSAPTSRKAQ
jgi:RNA polymerase sigma-70 factor (ECF subfamily)